MRALFRNAGIGENLEMSTYSNRACCSEQLMAVTKSTTTRHRQHLLATGKHNVVCKIPDK